MLSDSLDHLINYQNLKQSEYQEPQLQVPEAIPDEANDYNLTFKKQVRNSMMTRQGTHLINKNIFQNLEQIKQHEVLDKIKSLDINCMLQSHFDQEEMQNLKQLPNLSAKIYLKINLWLTWQQLIRNKKKRNSSIMNYRILKANYQERKQSNQTEEYRIYLFESLYNQYNKKIFIDSLKFNYWLSKFKILPDEMSEDEQNQLEDQSIAEQNQFIQLDQNQEEHQREANQKQSIYYNTNRIYIFVQIVSSITDRKKFQYFKTIFQNTRNKNNLVNQQSGQRYDFEEDNSEISGSEEEYQIENNMTEEQIKAHRINQINSFILGQATKIKLPTNNRQIVRNYFTRWKIYFLNNMIRLIRNDPDISNSKVQTSYQADLRGEEEREILTQYTSQENSLKKQKHELRAFLKNNRATQFFKLLTDNRVKYEMQSLFAFKLLKKCFRAFVIHTKMRQYQYQLEIYCHEVSQNQNQDDTVSKIFQKTNLLIKTFSALKLNRRVSKLVNILELTHRRLAVRCLIYSGREETQHNQRLKRYVAKRNRFLMFKYFNFLKKLSPNKIERVRQFKLKKQKQILQNYFLRLKLLMKIRMKNVKKVSHLRQKNQCHLFFECFKKRYLQNSYLQKRKMQLEMRIDLRKKRLFIQHIMPNYLQNLQERKLEIKQEQLKTWLLWNKIENNLKRWKMQNLKKKCYRAIEVRLVKYKERQQREKMFKIWKLRMQQKCNRKNKASSSHNVWLKKYYQQLCSIQK